MQASHKAYFGHIGAQTPHFPLMATQLNPVQHPHSSPFFSVPVLVAMASDTCPVCVGLDYDKFGAAPSVWTNDDPPPAYPQRRYRVVLREKIAAAAETGCNLCRVLAEGMMYFWGDQGLEELGPFLVLDIVRDESDESGDGFDDGNEKMEQKAKKDGAEVGEINSGGCEGGEEHCDKGESMSTGMEAVPGRPSQGVRWLTDHHNDYVCIALQPERSLTVTWIGHIQDRQYADSGISPRLDFYVETGKFCPPSESTPLGTAVSHSSQRWNAHFRQGDLRPAISNAFGPSSTVTSEIDLESAAKVLSTWLAGCENHLRCSERPGKLPRRLLDVSGETPPRLVETDTIERNSIPEYTTLSYCWGVPGYDTPPLRTTRDTYLSRTQGIEWSDLSPLFQDAALLTRGLGCRYLWIDSLCIVQDDEQDWVEQSASMADIYSQGYLNIAAAAATSPSASLFRDRQQFTRLDANKSPEFGRKNAHTIKPPVATMGPVYARRSHAHTHECVFADIRNGRESVCPLLFRAWVFQETLLSRRTVFFTQSELLWQCQKAVRCECNDLNSETALLSYRDRAGIDSNISRGGRSYEGIQQRFAEIASGRCSAQQARNFWLDAVGVYSEMALTLESDRPYAVAGIARRIQELTGDTYLAGLWLEDLPRQLLWVGLFSSSCAARRIPGIPSWSWMSRTDNNVDGAPGVLYMGTDDFRVDSHLRVIAEGTFCSTKAGDAFGTVLDGQVQLEAGILGAVVELNIPVHKALDPGPRFRLKFSDCLKGRCPRWPMPSLDCPEEETDPIRTGDIVHCVLIGVENTMGSPWEPPTAAMSLVLRQVEGRQGVYRRVGTVQHPPDLFVEAPVAVVTII